MPNAINHAHANANIKHVFVLMLENRSFDHLLGFSKITGYTPSGESTAINGLDGTESNYYNGKEYQVSKPADWSMPVGPGHEFLDIFYQLCGNTAQYQSGTPYPTIHNSGFVWDYANSPSHGEGKAPDNYAEIMKCYDTELQLPVLYTLATEFAVCDNWYSSMPGPTWPNRFFVHGASSCGLDDSPTTEQMAEWETGGVLYHKFTYPNGSIFDAIATKIPEHPWRIYGGVRELLVGAIPCVAALHNISLVGDWHYFDDFVEDINGDYPYFYTFIEPNYGNILDDSYQGGQSQHPRDDVRHGEALIKKVYETIRQSPLWENSLLIITYDEHGGFYDHVTPPAAVPPGDANTFSKHGFNFDQLGVRVPAVIVSPFIPKHTIDHTVYDHASIPATLTALLGLASLTARDEQAENVTRLLSLTEARTDTPTELPSPALSSSVPGAKSTATNLNVPTTPIKAGNLPGILLTVAKLEAELDGSENTTNLLSKVQAIKTQGDAKAYIEQVLNRVQTAK